MTNLNINIKLSDAPAVSALRIEEMLSVDFAPINGGYIYTDAMGTHFVASADFEEMRASMTDGGWKFV